MSASRPIDFDQPPEIGHPIRLKVRGRMRWLRLVKTEPYVRRRDGARSFILHWEDDHGYRYTSGLSGNSVTLAKPGGVVG